MKKVIVTGGSGFIGSNLSKFLIKKKFFVINIDKNKYLNKSNEILYNKKNYIFFKTDINNRKKINSILDKYKPNAIFNLAAETHVDRSIDNPSSFMKSNVMGVFNLLESIRGYKKKNKSDIKLIHVSTDEVYGDIASNERSNENDSYNPSSPYSATKASSDHLIKSYVRTFKIKAIISNCCNNYGPYQYPEKLIPTLIFNVMNNLPLPIYGKGRNSREWIHVEDHCEALFTIYKKGIIGESYNVGSGLNLTNLSLVKTLLKIVKENKIDLGKKVKIKFVEDRPGHDIRYALNCNKIKRQLKWKTKKSFHNGLKETLEWYINNKNFFSYFSKKIFFKRLGLNI